MPLRRDGHAHCLRHTLTPAAPPSPPFCSTAPSRLSLFTRFDEAVICRARRTLIIELRCRRVIIARRMPPPPERRHHVCCFRRYMRALFESGIQTYLFLH